MFYGSEPEDAVSFTDETSRENKERTSRRVWTHAQFSKYESLKWFNELRNLYPDVQGELKSSKIVKDFKNLEWNLKLRVSSGIRKARIHIVDTFTYEARAKQILRGIYKCDDYEKMLQNEPNKELAKLIISGMEDFVAESIIFDSPAQRLERNIKFKRNFRFGYGYHFALEREAYRRKQLSADLKPFRKGSKKVYDTASKYVSKSGAVFADAVEFSERGFFGEYEMRQHVSEMLNVSHAFDKGDDKSIEWLEEQREYFIENTDYRFFCNGSKLYGDIESKLSVRTQAADLAAGIAQKKYDRYGLEAVFEDFDYVTFNGERITESNVRERLYEWKQIEERELKIQKLISGLKNIY